MIEFVVGAPLMTAFAMSTQPHRLLTSDSQPIRVHSGTAGTLYLHGAGQLSFVKPVCLEVAEGPDGLEASCPELGLLVFGNDPAELHAEAVADLEHAWRAYVEYDGPLSTSGERVRAAMMRHVGG